MMPADTGLSAIEAIRGRKSVRAFLPTLVEEETVRAILAIASRAASGTNIQPWLVHVVTGEARDRLSTAALAAAEAGENSLEYPYHPEKMGEPYLSRRRKVGFDLYALYGVERTDMAGRKAAMLRNYSFFGAPVGLFFTMERDHGLGAWLDCGLFMQNVMIAARGFDGVVRVFYNVCQHRGNRLVTAEVGMITPPVGLNCFVVARYSGRPVAEVFHGVFPHFIAHLFAIAILVVWPQIILWLPIKMGY